MNVSGFFLLASLAIAATAAILVYGLITVAIGWLDRHARAEPTARSSHSTPTAQGGGAIVVPVALAVAGIALAAGGGVPAGGTAYAAIIGVLVLALALIGFVDDMRSLDVVSRLVSQLIAVGIAVALLPAEMRVLPPSVPLALERLIVIGCGLWFVNLVNFMDGIDLISVVETVAVTLGFVLLAAFGVISVAYGYVAVALLGAMVGFSPWNAPRARLFLGDAGSIPIGFLLAVLLIHLAGSNALAAAVILPLYYLADATVTLLRRLFRGDKVWEAHREHFYQQATRNGFSVTEVVGRIAVLNAALIALALGAALHGTVWAGAALAIAAVAVGLTLRAFAKGRP
jgi:UDP-N-acetylmuramyl pentapeptide phosphotransferase/UDP-N-acetylglucosamine-1-phosphate transferase